MHGNRRKGGRGHCVTHEHSHNLGAAQVARVCATMKLDRLPGQTAAGWRAGVDPQIAFHNFLIGGGEPEHAVHPRVRAESDQVPALENVLLEQALPARGSGLWW